MNVESTTRRKFIKMFSFLIFFFMGYTLFRLIRKEKDSNRNNRKVFLPLENNDGIFLYNSCIIHYESGNISLFSAKCTHLGCLINKTEYNELVCSCHGSKFSLDGKVINGPAFKDLQKLSFEIDKKNNRIVVDI
jgi:cytochrome b6-f complex iron-sulfur subunit